MTTARDIMTEDPACVLATDTIGTAIETLQALDVRHLPVVNESNELIGILSDRDLRFWVRAVAPAEGEPPRPLEQPVSALMSSNVLSVEAETQVAEIVSLMLENKIGAVPVLDADETLIGIVSYMDVLRSISFD